MKRLSTLAICAALLCASAPAFAQTRTAGGQTGTGGAAATSAPQPAVTLIRNATVLTVSRGR